MVPFQLFVDRYGVRPAGALMVEDMAKNLAPAAELGMTTAWVRNPADWGANGADGGHIHHIVDDLGAFLSAATALHPSKPGQHVSP